MQRRILLLTALALSACAASDHTSDLGVVESLLTPDERRVRLTQIRDAAADAGITNGVILAGIAENETGLAHCWSEATWACQGPASADCAGGPVIAGAGDGPCELLQGGLGMFQFDAGTYEQTLAREGDRVLLVAGNVQAAIDFTTSMVIRSVYVDGVDTREQAIAWMNEVRVDGFHFTEWIQTVTHYYNGCVPGSCSVYDSRFANYSNGARRVYEEMGHEFWYGTPPPPCEAIPAAGRVIDETERSCTLRGGDLRYWREATDAGYGGTLLWTNATDSAAPANYFVWTLRFERAGEYALETYTDAAYALSVTAPYTITHAGGVAELRLDQTEVDGFAPLGTYRFEAGVDYAVRVDDDSGKPVATMTHIVADALRVTPVSAPPGDAAVETDASVIGDASMPPSRGVASGCACGVARTSSAPPLFALGLMLALALLRGSRR